MSKGIKFGTRMAGDCGRRVYRGHIRLAAAGIAAYVKTLPERTRVVAAILGFWVSGLWRGGQCAGRAGVTPIVIPEAAPTPAIAYAVHTLKTSGAINFTASHNPPEYKRHQVLDARWRSGAARGNRAY